MVPTSRLTKKPAAEHQYSLWQDRGNRLPPFADNYIALFSRFHRCGTYEATYILDALPSAPSDLQPRRVHADTHGQSAAVFGLPTCLVLSSCAYPPAGGSYRLYRPERDGHYRRIRFDVQWHGQLGADP